MTKKQFQTVFNSIGRVTNYSGKTRTMYVHGVNTIADTNKIYSKGEEAYTNLIRAMRTPQPFKVVYL